MKIQNSKILTIIAVITAAVLIIGLAVLDAFSFGKKFVSVQGFAMGSVITVSLYGTDSREIADEITAAIENDENAYISKYKEGSDIFKLNKNGTLIVSEKTAAIIRSATEISRITDGAFDITVGAVSALWDFDSGKMLVPEREQIENTLKSCGYEKLEVNGSRITLYSGSSLDLGAVGKGVGCDTALEIIKKYPEITGAVVSVGGTVLTYGEPSDAKEWTVGIKNPVKNDDSVFMTLKLSGTNFISTSGNYEKSFEKDGILYHHILSTENGYPAQTGIKSVTVLAKSGEEADAYSTAAFVKGISGSKKMAEDAQLSIIFISDDNTVTASPSLIPSIKLLNGGEIKPYE